MYKSINIWQRLSRTGQMKTTFDNVSHWSNENYIWQSLTGQIKTTFDSLSLVKWKLVEVNIAAATAAFSLL